jgi:DNA-binding transcriptional LysR family regulator
MDRYKQLETFVAVATKGSLSAVANAQGVAPAIIGRRLDALEERLGVKLITRTTRKLTLTFEGMAFLEDSQRLLNDLNNAEASVSAGGLKPSGHLRITAPAGFGRRHVAPLIPSFLNSHPEVSVALDLSDRLVEIVNEGFDLAIRIGNLDDSSLVGIKLADNRRVLVASAAYIAKFGQPKTPSELSQHRCLTFGTSGTQSRGWLFTVDGAATAIKVPSFLECNDGAVLHEWALAGQGLAWRSMWEVGDELASGKLVLVLEQFSAPINAIYAVFPQRKHLPLRVRVFIDLLKDTYGDLAYWKGQR